MADFSMTKVVQSITASFLDVSPVVLKIVAILVIGIIISKLFARLVGSVLRRLKLEESMERLGALKFWKKVAGERSIVAAIASVVLYLGYLGTLMMLSSSMGFNGLNVLFARFFAFVPHLAVAVVICGVGAFVAEFVQNIVENVASKRRDLIAPKILGQFANAMVLMFSILMAAGQLGLHIELLQSLMVIFLGSVTFSLVFGFALGAQHFVGQWVARYYITKEYELGEYIQVGEHKGMLFQFAPMVVILKTDAEHIVMPYQNMMESQVTRLTKAEVLP